MIPERGSWIELQVTRKETLSVRIDQSGKFSAITLLRAMSPEYSTNEQILRTFYETESVSVTAKNLDKITGKTACGDVVDPDTGEVLVESGQVITAAQAERFITTNLAKVELIAKIDDPLVLQSVAEDPTATHEEALLKIYPADIAWVASAASASTASSTKTSPKTR